MANCLICFKLRAHFYMALDRFRTLEVIPPALAPLSACYRAFCALRQARDGSEIDLKGPLSLLAVLSAIRSSFVYFSLTSEMEDALIRLEKLSPSALEVLLSEMELNQVIHLAELWGGEMQQYLVVTWTTPAQACDPDHCRRLLHLTALVERMKRFAQQRQDVLC